jgi:hypothetical protein
VSSQSYVKLPGGSLSADAASSGDSLRAVSVPEGSCTGTGERPLTGSLDFDRKAKATGVCPVCLGRFRVSQGVLPNHAPSPNLETLLAQS